MELSHDQEKALAALLGWYKDPARRPFITLGGYAGTGKTTLIAVFRRELARLQKGLKVSFCSYTGKAAQNMRGRLKESGATMPGDTVGTIHGLIYTPRETSDGRIAGWDRKESLERHLIIVDEASMVDSVIWHDLLSYGVPVAAVGDHGQLPPIEGKFNLMRAPEIMLTHIHRQARGNPIIEVSEAARSTGIIGPRRYGQGVVKYLKDDPDAAEKSGELLESWSPETMILCGYNSTRNKLNQFIRGNRGFETAEPSSGDRVICLRNNRKKGVFNGMLGTLSHIASYFTADRKLAMLGDLFDFGYALTVHKAQGGQARRVVMFEERFPKMDDDTWRRWLYTGVTRAEEELYLFG